MRTERILKGHVAIVPSTQRDASGGFVWCVDAVDRGDADRLIDAWRGHTPMPREADALDVAAQMAEQIAATFEPPPRAR